MPQNAGGFGSISDAAAVWASLELEPMQARLQQVNELIGEEVVRFAPFDAPGRSKSPAQKRGDAPVRQHGRAVEALEHAE